MCGIKETKTSRIETLDELIKQGNSYLLESHKQKDAFQCFYRASKLAPNNSDIWFKLGKIIDDAEIEEEPIISLKDLLSVDPDLNTSNFNQIICWEKVVHSDPSNIEAWKGLADIYDSIQEYNKAENCYKKVVELDPKNIEALCQRAGCLHYLSLKIDEYENTSINDINLLNEAVTCYADAIELDPKEAADYEVYYWMAEISLLKDNKEESIKWFQKQIYYTNDSHCIKEKNRLIEEIKNKKDIKNE